MIERHSIAFIFCALILTSCTREPKKDSLSHVFRRINAEVLQNSKAYATLKEATSSIGHRLTGSSNGTRAEEYAYNKFKEYGFDSVRYDEFEVVAWSRGDVKVSIGGSQVPAVTLAHSPLKSDITGDIADVGNGLEADYSQDSNRVRGKIASIYLGLLEGTDIKATNLHRSEKAAIAIRHGAIGIIMYNQVAHGVLLTGTASTTGKILPVPAVCISKEAGMALREKLKSQKVAAHIVMTNHADRITARNVIATLRGSQLPDERIIVGGHLDSWDLATGAIDNGIGSFAVLDIARAFNAGKLIPKRTIQFILFMGEEQGLLGSRHRVNEEVRLGTIDQIKYMMNLDMSGNPNGIHAGSKLDDTLFFKNMGAEIHSVDTVFSNHFTKGAGLHSDHEHYLLEGIPIVGVISNLDKSVYDCYHADCDDFRLVNEEHLRNTARFGTMIVYGLETAEVLPAHKLDSEATRQMLIDSNLKEKLVIAGDWKWEK